MPNSKIYSTLDKSWLNVLKNEFSAPYFLALKEFLVTEKQQFEIYPSGNQIFSALNLTPFDKVKVVILGQDPYHGPQQANGLAFSVNPSVKLPPSLRNIYKELQHDLKAPVPASGDLSLWAKQGVLLLNATLTVRKSEPGSHQNRGWEKFTDKIIDELNDQKTGLIFILWGKFAQQKAERISKEKHHVLKAPHPSPFSAHRGFFGSKPFSKANALLEKMNKKTINWQLP